ncbi:hypothetical protein FE257_002386 [Aspergillus nanangensis]|uniref:Uncharacterized protein n=1 Tax=Aspergillus nanangensis TaxID=2582783 RepID=A0AAD4CDT2_ASPNN|nr:hypothetical protein FE257_002386 [Aspergillus nanangensis]
MFAERSYQGGLESLSTLKLQESLVEDHLTASIHAAARCPPLNETGSKQIMAALGKPGPTFMSELLDSITEKASMAFPTQNKRTFGKNGAKPAVLGWLQSLYRFSNELPEALEKITVKSDSEEIEMGRQWSNTLFEKALAACE